MQPPSHRPRPPRSARRQLGPARLAAGLAAIGWAHAAGCVVATEVIPLRPSPAGLKPRSVASVVVLDAAPDRPHDALARLRAHEVTREIEPGDDDGELRARLLAKAAQLGCDALLVLPRPAPSAPRVEAPPGEAESEAAGSAGPGEGGEGAYREGLCLRWRRP